jgi:hypothetical protein
MLMILVMDGGLKKFLDLYSDPVVEVSSNSQARERGGLAAQR